MKPKEKRKGYTFEEYMDFIDKNLIYVKSKGHFIRKSNGKIFGWIENNTHRKPPLKRRRVALINGKTRFYNSHLVFWKENGRFVKEGLQLDHINSDTVDDRINNLREVNGSSNCRNSKGKIKKHKLPKGIHFCDNRFFLQIMTKDKDLALKYQSFLEKIKPSKAGHTSAFNKTGGKEIRSVFRKNSIHYSASKTFPIQEKSFCIDVMKKMLIKFKELRYYGWREQYSQFE